MLWLAGLALAGLVLIAVRTRSRFSRGVITAFGLLGGGLVCAALLSGLFLYRLVAAVNPPSCVIPASPPATTTAAPDHRFPNDLRYPNATTVTVRYDPPRCAPNRLFHHPSMTGSQLTTTQTTPDAPSTILDWYARHMTASGWAVRTTPRDAPGTESFDMNGDVLAVSVAAHKPLNGPVPPPCCVDPSLPTVVWTQLTRAAG